MESPNRTRNYAVDELRGWAALLVLFYHSVHTGAKAVGVNGGHLVSGNNPFAALIYEGHTGVALFMVLSGYILASGTFGKDISYAGFIRNRALRIFPLMIVVLIFALCASKENLSLGRILAPFLLLANTNAAFTDPTGLASTVWTISVEFQFYLIAPFLFLFVDRRGMKFLLSAVLLFWLLRMVIFLRLLDDPYDMARIGYFTIAGRINEFMIGIGLAYMVDRRVINLAGNRTVAFVWLAASSVVILAGMMAINNSGGTIKGPWRFIYPEIEGLLEASFIAAYLTARPFQDFSIGRAVQAIGTVSFSLYILHYALVGEFWGVIYKHMFDGLLTGVNGILIATCIIAVPIVAMAALSYWCI